MTAVFDTQYDGQGANQFKTNMAQVDQSMQTAEKSATSFSTNYTAMGKKMERPLGRLAFAGLAESMIGGTDAMAGASHATVALEGGLHAVGNALLFVQPEFGLLAIGLAAVVTLFVKLTASSQENAENIQKAVSASAQQAKTYTDSADALKKAGIIDTEQVGILKNLSKASTEQIATTVKKIETERDHIKSMIAEDEAIIASVRDQNEVKAATADMIVQKEKLTAITKASTGLLDYETAQQAKTATGIINNSKHLENQLKTYKELIELKAKMNKGGASDDDKKQVDAQIASMSKLGLSSDELTKKIIQNDMKVMDMEKQITATNSKEKNAQILADIDNYNQVSQIEQEIINLKENSLEEQAKTLDKFIGIMSVADQKGGIDLVDNAKKTMGSIVSAVAAGYALQLSLQAIKDAASFNYAGAALDIAGAAAITMAGNTFASAMGGSSAPASSSPSVSRGSNQSVNSPSGNPGGGPNGQGGGHSTYFQFQVLGSIDTASSAMIAKGLTEYVQQNQGTLVSSVNQPAYGKIAGYG